VLVAVQERGEPSGRGAGGGPGKGRAFRERCWWRERKGARRLPWKNGAPAKPRGVVASRERCSQTTTRGKPSNLSSCRTTGAK
jgi:hypothetical protein